MAKLVPFTKVMQKQMGFVNTKQGLMVNKKKLTDIIKYQKKDDKIVKNIKDKKDVKTQEKQALEAKGIY